VAIKAVLFDVIGTTIVEHDPNTIVNCFEKAFRDHGFVVDAHLVRANRGRDKKEMIDLAIANQHLPPDSSEKIYQSFLNNVELNLNQFGYREGAEELFHHLRKQEIKIGLGTGLSRDLLEKITDHVGWSFNQFDYIGIPEGAIRSRPHPDMIRDMIKKFQLQPNEVLKVGDTVADIQEGKSAGVLTVAIAAGTQPENMLQEANPNFLIHSLAELIAII
jgi:phosphonoacetaldehyde hydrolase